MMFKKNKDYVLRNLTEYDIHKQVQFKANLKRVFDDQRMLPLMCNILNGTNATDPRILLTPDVNASRPTYYLLGNDDYLLYSDTKKKFNFNKPLNFNVLMMCQLTDRGDENHLPRFTKIAAVRIIENLDGTASLKFESYDKAPFITMIQDFERTCQNLFNKITNQLLDTPLYKMLSNEELTEDRIQKYCNEIATKINDNGYQVKVTPAFHQTNKNVSVDLVLENLENNSERFPHKSNKRLSKFNIFSYSTENQYSYFRKNKQFELQKDYFSNVSKEEEKLDDVFKQTCEQLFN